MNTQEEYNKETGLYHYDSGSMDFKWSDEYVKWLEKRIEALTIPVVSDMFSAKKIEDAYSDGLDYGMGNGGLKFHLENYR